MGIWQWVAVGAVAWIVVSVALALLLGAVLGAKPARRRMAARRTPSHVPHTPGCTGSHRAQVPDPTV